MEDGRQFFPMYFDFVESKVFSRIGKNPLGLYARMRRYVCRARSGHSLSDFYIKGVLATSGYLDQYARAFDVSRATISRWLAELEEVKFIATYRRAEKGHNQPNIWILGVVHHYEGSQWGIEAFFADHDAMAQDQDANVPETFDTSKGEAIIASVAKADNLTVSYLQRSVQRLVQPLNIEEVIDKSNSPPATLDDDFPVLEEEYVDLDADGFPTTPKHPLIKHIASRGRKLTDNQEQRLKEGVPRHNPQHPSPAALFLSNPLFTSYIDDKIAWANGGTDGKRKPNGSLVSSICNYTAEKFGWLDYKAEHTEQEGETTHTPLAPGWQTEAEKKEYTEEELDEMAERLSQQKPVRTGVILR